MTIPLESIPRFGLPEALAIARREYGVAGGISRLPSERDQNFLIRDARGARFVLKIANSNDSAELLDFQNQAMSRIEKSLADCRVPRVVSSLHGLEVANARHADSGAEYRVRLLTWVEGEVLADTADRGSALFESIGAGMAGIDASLRDFSHPAMRRVLHWDLRRAEMARENAALLPHGRRARVERLFAQWEEIDWTRLRYSVIHGDANDHNIIVENGRMAGMLDFGDLVASATVCDLAIALAYTLLGEPRPRSVAAEVIRAYQRHYPLTIAEQDALYPLILTRLCMSVCYSAYNRTRNPNDPYQVVTEAAAWTLLDDLEGWPVRDWRAFVRETCELISSPPLT